MWTEILLALLVICYVLHSWAFSYWKRRGIFQVDGSFLFGNIKDILFLKRTLDSFAWEIYEKHKQQKLVGIYSFYKPVLIATDADLIRQIIVKDFTSFSGPPVEVDMKLDPVFGVNPFAAPDIEKWKEIRGLHVPLLTPSKLKSIPDLMVKIGHNMLKYIKKNESSAFKVKDICELIAIDTAISFSYGYEPTAFTDPENPFRKYARDLFTEESALAINSYFLYPKLSKLLRYRAIKKEAEDFFVSFCKKMLELRRNCPSDRQDFFEHMIKLNMKRKEEGKTVFTDAEIAYHCMTTYVDSFFTTASSFGYLLMELSTHPDIQDELREEILSVGDKMEDFDYDKVNSLSLLQMALSESLRMHPPVLVSARKCSKTCQLAGKEIEAGTFVLLPYSALHRDPKYFPEPEKYNPKRYLSEDSHVKGALLPFGDGPRMCIGHRYAQILIKLGIVYLLLNFKILPEKKAEGKREKKDDLFPFAAPNEDAIVIFEPLAN